MANIPTQEQVAKLHKQSRDAISKKRRVQKKQGKGFVDYGQGVIPERVWQNLPGKTLDKSEGV